MSEHNGNNGNHKAANDPLELDRDVVRCKICQLVQYRTRVGNCRRCLRMLPAKVEYLIPPPPVQDLPGDDRQLLEDWHNSDTVEHIGERIRQLRESRGMTQSQLQSSSKVSRSYLSRIESGQMTPSLGTLEKISEALSVGLSRFFVPESTGEALLEDPFIQGLKPFLRQLDWAQWQSILKRLALITDHVSVAPVAHPASNGLRVNPAPQGARPEAQRITPITTRTAMQSSRLRHQ
ncbi:MAG: helix-turn-helix transcriptional regulator [Acidobacteria bacterium]|nr:helix-turn-helix transcriptional regulator [Acidobacteriota bacterium]